MRTTFLFTFFLAATSFLNAQDTIQALFLGNSYTGVNNLPALTASIATGFGDALDYDSNTPGGYTLEGHSTNATTTSKINSKAWDFVILQEQSQKPSFHPSQVANEVYPYADSLNATIKANDSCTKTMYYMTWGRENGDQSNCQFYAPVCTYNGMQTRLKDSYLTMGANYGDEVAPVGMAWKYTRDNNPTIDLYTADESHPSLAGSYLAACTFYAAMFRKSAVGAVFPGGLDSLVADTLARNASHVVMDSLSNWYIDTTAFFANFTNVPGGMSVQFYDSSYNADSWFWTFGDGDSSFAQSPQHTYSSAGTYVVTLIAYRGCDVDTITESVTITNPVGVGSHVQEFRVGPNPFGDEIRVMGLKGEAFEWQVVDATGRAISSGKSLDDSAIISTVGFRSGIYILKVGDKSLLMTKLRN